ncbi:hypothetical protein WDU94_015143 [Cyamophila willieti]
MENVQFPYWQLFFLASCKGNRHMIRKELDIILEKNLKEDTERKEYLFCEIQKSDEILREKTEERNIRFEKSKGVTQVMRKLVQKIEKQECLMSCLIKKKLILSEAISLLNNQRDLMDHKFHKVIDELLHTMHHNVGKYQKDIDDRKLAIEQSKQENSKLLVERNQLLETLNKTKSEVDRLSGEKNEDSQELENCVKIRDELKDSMNSNAEDIGDRAAEIVSLYTDIAALRNSLQNCEKQVEFYRKQSDLVVHENKQYQESVRNLEEITFQSESDICDFENQIKKYSREIEVLENILHLKDSHYDHLENQRLILKLDAEFLLENVEKLRECLILDVTEYSDLKRKIEEMIKIEIQSEVDEYKTKTLSDIQEQIMKEKENHTKLVREVESLDQSLMDQNNQLVRFILEKEILTNKYTDTEISFKKIKSEKHKKDSHITLLEKEIKQITDENQNFIKNCNILEEEIHDNNDGNIHTKNNITISIKDENVELEKKLSLLENTLIEEQTTGKTYKREIEELTRGNTSAENKIMDLIHAKEEKIELQKEKEELEHKCKIMQSQYVELHNCTEALVSVVRTLKEKSENRSRVTDDPRSFSVTYDSDSSIF